MRTEISPPLVSILLPAFNAAATLPACLRSILRQTVTSWECIVVDDGSEDGTLALLREVADHDRRFVVLSAPHAGLVAALNAGLAHSGGRFVARMDADDLMHRDRLAAQLRRLAAEPALAAVGCHVRLFPRGGMRDGRREYERWVNSFDEPWRLRADAFVECPIVHPTLMIRGPRLRALGYRDRGWPEDYDLILRLLEAGEQVSVVPRRLLCWRDLPGRLSRTAEQYSLERFIACKAAFLAARFLAGGDTYILWGYGETGRALQRALAAHGKRPVHVVEVHPGRLGNIIQGAPVIPPDALRSVPRRPIVVSVAGSGARRQIREALTAMGFCELRDFLCAA